MREKILISKCSKGLEQLKKENRTLLDLVSTLKKLQEMQEREIKELWGALDSAEGRLEELESRLAAKVPQKATEAPQEGKGGEPIEEPQEAKEEAPQNQSNDL